MPPTSTIWSRLEPYARDPTLDAGLRAAVHDPLWLLARQWQIGEFGGEDAGSPASTRLRMQRTPVTRYLPGDIPDDWYQDGMLRAGATASGQLLDGKVPLETLIERERVLTPGVPQFRLAAQIGLQLRRLLTVAALRTALLTRFPLAAPDEDPEQPLDADTRRFLAVTVGRVPDGQLLYFVLQAVRDSGTLSGLPDAYRSRVSAGIQTWQTWLSGLSATDRASLTTARNDWLAWCDSLFAAPSAVQPDAWAEERLEYKALVSAYTPAGEVVLTTPEHYGGHLDWYSFDALPVGLLGATRADLAASSSPAEQFEASALAAPVTFRGMPASRYWEFEDARVDFASATTSTLELARMLLIEFALVYGNDWLVVPVTAPVGTLCQTNWLVVTDTFGERTLVSSARALDEAAASGQEGSAWRMFQLSRDPRPAPAGRRTPDALFLPPTLGPSLHGEPFEEVVLLRDELANMAWAVERVVETPIGLPLNRSEAYVRARSDSANPPNGAQPALPRYLLETEVPDHWLPLYPERVRTEAPAIRFMLGDLPLGRILKPPRTPDQGPLRIQDEEVPREGSRVTRAYQYARWTNGLTYLWVGRRKGTGRGEGSSGLRFDVLEGSETSPP